MKDKENNAIDFGEWTCPTSWDDINLKTYQEIERYYEDKDKKTDIREIVHILCGKTIDEVNSLPSEFLDIILEKLAFLQKSPEVKEPTNKIVIDGDEYSVNIMEKLKTGEYVAFDTVLKNDKHNYAAMLAILCRKHGEVYDSKYEAEVLNDRIKMFESVPVVKVLEIISFFLNLWLILGRHSQLYMEVEEAVNHIQQNIATSQKLGAFRKLYLKWRMKKLIKSLRSISNTSQTSSHSLRTLFRKVKCKKLRINTRSN